MSDKIRYWGKKQDLVPIKVIIEIEKSFVAALHLFSTCDGNVLRRGILRYKCFSN